MKHAMKDIYIYMKKIINLLNRINIIYGFLDLRRLEIEKNKLRMNQFFFINNICTNHNLCVRGVCV